MPSDATKNKTGKFITLEGGEGVGKSTNLSFVQQLLERHGLQVVVTHEPGGTNIGGKIRQLLLDNANGEMNSHTELLLIFAARAQNLHEVITPALARGCWVLSDRFTDATYAYQGGGRQLGYGIIRQLETAIQGNLRPDLTLLLDAPLTVTARRMEHNKLDRFETQQAAFFRRVRAAYLQRAKDNPQTVVINAAQPLQQVQAAIKSALQPLLAQAK